jgi:tetratricopeptide (TPR) repeat protein
MEVPHMSERATLADLRSTALAVARAHTREVPTYAPSHYAAAMLLWQQAQRVAVYAGRNEVQELLEQARLALDVATARAAESRELLAELVQLRASSLRHDGQRYYAAKAVLEAEASYWQAIAAAEDGDVHAAQQHGRDARRGYLQARGEFFERGVLDHLDRSLTDAPLLTEEDRDLLRREIANLRAAAARGHVEDDSLAAALQTSAAIQLRIDAGHRGPPTPGEGEIFAPEEPGWAPGTHGPPDAATLLRITGRDLDSDGRASLSLAWNWSLGSFVHVLLRQREGGPWEKVYTATQPNGPTVTHTDTGLDPDVDYCYAVSARNQWGRTPGRFPNHACGHTLHPSRLPVWRIQLRIRTADIPDAGSDDSVQVCLNSPDDTYVPSLNSTWLDYGPRPIDPSSIFLLDDFARGRDFPYDLLLDNVAELSDITMLMLHKEGSDAVAIAELSLCVNGVEVFSRQFGETTRTCLWLDEGDGHSPIYTIHYPELRAHPKWQAFLARRPQPFTPDDDGELSFRIENKEIVSRIEGMVGNFLHGTSAYWGHFYGSAWVEAVRLDEQRLRVDLDLAAEATGLNPEVDINFDLKFEAICDEQDKPPYIKVTTENFDAEADFDTLQEIVTFGIINFWEDNIADRIEESFKPITQEISTGGICPTVQVTENGDIVFRAR